MRRVIAWVVDGLPFEARSRRALDETLVDWAHEEQEESTTGGRVLVGVRGALAVARVASISLVRETTDFSWCRGLASRLRVFAAVVTLAALALTLAATLPGLGARTLGLALTIVPALLLGFLPAAVFLMLAWRPEGRSLPTVGTACVVTLAALAFGLLVVSPSNELFATLALDAIKAKYGVSDPLGATAGTRPAFRNEFIMMWTVSQACLVGAVVLFAAAVARQSPLSNRWWLAGVPVAAAVSSAVVKFAIGLPLLLAFHIGDRSVLPHLLAAWTMAILVLVLAVSYPRPVTPPSTSS